MWPSGITAIWADIKVKDRGSFRYQNNCLRNDKSMRAHIPKSPCTEWNGQSRWIVGDWSCESDLFDRWILFVWRWRWSRKKAWITSLPWPLTPFTTFHNFTRYTVIYYTYERIRILTSILSNIRIFDNFPRKKWQQYYFYISINDFYYHI